MNLLKKIYLIIVLYFINTNLILSAEKEKTNEELMLQTVIDEMLIKKEKTMSEKICPANFTSGGGLGEINLAFDFAGPLKDIHKQISDVAKKATEQVTNTLINMINMLTSDELIIGLAVEGIAYFLATLEVAFTSLTNVDISSCLEKQQEVGTTAAAIMGTSAAGIGGVKTSTNITKGLSCINNKLEQKFSRFGKKVKNNKLKWVDWIIKMLNSNLQVAMSSNNLTGKKCQLNQELASKNPTEINVISNITQDIKNKSLEILGKTPILQFEFTKRMNEKIKTIKDYKYLKKLNKNDYFILKSIEEAKIDYIYFVKKEKVKKECKKDIKVNISTEECIKNKLNIYLKDKRPLNNLQTDRVYEDFAIYIKFLNFYIANIEKELSNGENKVEEILNLIKYLNNGIGEPPSPFHTKKTTKYLCNKENKQDKRYVLKSFFIRDLYKDKTEILRSRENGRLIFPNLQTCELKDSASNIYLYYLTTEYTILFLNELKEELENSKNKFKEYRNLQKENYFISNLPNPRLKIQLGTGNKEQKDIENSVTQIGIKINKYNPKNIDKKQEQKEVKKELKDYEKKPIIINPEEYLYE